MELRAEPLLGEDLAADRMDFWEKMVWKEKERTIDLQQLYYRTTNFLTENNVNIH